MYLLWIWKGFKVWREKSADRSVLLPDDGVFGVAWWTLNPLSSLQARRCKIFVEQECLLSKQSVYGTGSDRLSLSGRGLFLNGWHWLVYVPDGSLGLLITCDLEWPQRQSIGGRGWAGELFFFSSVFQLRERNLSAVITVMQLLKYGPTMCWHHVSWDKTRFSHSIDEIIRSYCTGILAFDMLNIYIFLIIKKLWKHRISTLLVMSKY